MTFPPSGVKDFFDYLHGNNQHFVPIVDSAIYIPNPQNASDAYDTYTRGNASGSFMTNPDGSQYVSSVLRPVFFDADSSRLGLYGLGIPSFLIGCLQTA